MAALFHEGCKQQSGHSSDMVGDFDKRFGWTAAMGSRLLSELRFVTLSAILIRLDSENPGCLQVTHAPARNLSPRPARHSFHWRGGQGNVLISAAGEFAQRGGAHAQTARAVRHQSAERSRKCAKRQVILSTCP